MLLTLLAAALLQVPTETGSIRGQVRSEASGEPLSAAVVEVIVPGAPRRVSTGQGGEYVLTGVPAGRRLVRARYLGHAPLDVEVMVSPGNEVRLDLFLPLQPVPLAPVRVDASATGSVTESTAADDPDLAIAGARAIQSSSGIAEIGIADVARGTPGQEPVDASDVLYVRGAGADLKLVYLDGAPVFAPFPVGGLMEPFPPELLRSADVYLGGAPARHDGGLSYILDMRTRTLGSEGFRASGAADLLSLRALVEVPLAPGFTVLGAGRGVHRFGTRTLLDQPNPYAYNEGIARADLRVGRTGMLSVTGFANAEEVWLDAAGAPDSVIAWGNRALSLRYRGSIGQSQAEWTAAVGRYDARLPLDGLRPMIATGEALRARVSADFTRRFEEVDVRYGASLERQEQRYSGRNAPHVSAPDPGSFAAEGDVAAAYLDAAYSPVPQLRLRGGLRASHFSVGGPTLAPRLSATWLVSDRAALTLAGGRYHQYLRAPERSVLAPLPPPFQAPATDHRLSLGSATHFAVSLDQDLGEQIRLGLQGYFKSFEGVPGSDATEANASGVDLWLRRSAGEVRGWLGYSLAWAWSVPELGGPNRFAGRQLLSAGLATTAARFADLSMRFAYGGGLPYSAIPMAPSDAWPGSGLSSADGGFRNTTPPPTPENLTGAPDAAPLLPHPDRSYLRLDLSASRTWEGRWRDAEFRLVPYVRIINSLGQRDALFYRYHHSTGGSPEPIGALPLLPIVGLEWRF